MLLKPHVNMENYTLMVREYGYGGYKYDGDGSVKRYYWTLWSKKGSRVLDVGCAKGFLVKDFLDLGIDAYGLDISEYALKNCEEETVEDYI